MDIGYFDRELPRHAAVPQRARPRRAAPRARRRHDRRGVLRPHAGRRGREAAAVRRGRSPARPALELLLPLTLKWARGDAACRSPRRSRRITCDAARVLGIDAGHLAPGARRRRLHLRSRSATGKSSPLRSRARARTRPISGIELQGRVRCTLVDGQVVYESVNAVSVERVSLNQLVTAVARSAAAAGRIDRPAHIAVRSTPARHFTLTESTHESPARFFRPAALCRFQARARHARRRRAARREPRARRAPRRARRARRRGTISSSRWRTRTSGSAAPGAQVGHLNAVMNSPELREVYNANLPKITQYYTELSQHQGLYAKFKALRAVGGVRHAHARRSARIIENELRDFRLGGAELPPDGEGALHGDPRAAVAALVALHRQPARRDQRLRALRHRRRGGRRHPAGRAARRRAKRRRADGREGWKFTLHAPSYMPGACSTRTTAALRELMYRAYVTRASEFGKPEWDNTPLIAEILKLRRELAQLLGFANYAEYSLDAQDGGVAAAGARVPERARRAREALRRARPRRS